MSLAYVKHLDGYLVQSECCISVSHYCNLYTSPKLREVWATSVSRGLLHER